MAMFKSFVHLLSQILHKDKGKGEDKVLSSAVAIYLGSIECHISIGRFYMEQNEKRNKNWNNETIGDGGITP